MAQVRQRTDTVGSPNPPDSDLLGMTNQAFCRWYDRVVGAYGTDEFFSTGTFTTVAQQADYSLLNLFPDFYKLRFVDLLIGPGGAKVPIEPYNEALRDAYNLGQNVFIPSGQVISVNYIPAAPQLQQYASVFVHSFDLIDGITFQSVYSGTYGTTLYLETFAPSGAGSISVVANGGGGQVIQLTPPAASTNMSLSGFVNNAANWPNANPLLSATASQNGFDVFSTAMSATQLSGTIQFDYINGWERFVISDTAAQLMQRLERDSTMFDAECKKFEQELISLAAIRDVGQPQEMKDFEAEQAQWPWAPPFLRGYVYRLQGGNIHLVSMLAGVST